MSVAWAGLAASVVVPMITAKDGSQAIQQGTDAQVNANQMGIAEMRRATEQQRADLAPWVNSGNLGNNELMRRLGLGGNGRVGGYTPKSLDQLRNEMRGQFTTQKATPGLISGRGYQLTQREDPENQLGGVRWSDGVQGPDTFTSSIDEAGLNAAAQAAFNAQGAASDGQVDPMYGSLLAKFNEQDWKNDFVAQNGLEFGLKTGTNALNQRAAAGGSYGSGAALKALTKFGNDYGTRNTEGAYNRSMGEKNQIFGMLSDVSKQGQSAAAGQGAAGMSGANSIAGMYGNIGNSQAAGGIGQANALGGAAAGATNALQWNQLINRKPATTTYNPSDYGMGFDRYLSGNFGSGD